MSRENLILETGVVRDLYSIRSVIDFYKKSDSNPNDFVRHFRLENDETHASLQLSSLYSRYEVVSSDSFAINEKYDQNTDSEDCPSPNVSAASVLIFDRELNITFAGLVLSGNMNANGMVGLDMQMDLGVSRAALPYFVGMMAAQTLQVAPKINI